MEEEDEAWCCCWCWLIHFITDETMDEDDDNQLDGWGRKADPLLLPNWSQIGENLLCVWSVERSNFAQYKRAYTMMMDDHGNVPFLRNIWSDCFNGSLRLSVHVHQFITDPIQLIDSDDWWADFLSFKFFFQKQFMKWPLWYVSIRGFFSKWPNDLKIMAKFGKGWHLFPLYI